MAKRAQETADVEVAEPVEAEAEPEATEGAAPAPTVRRAPGQKEIIPMAWKLVGTSAGTPVTLLRCLDRKDAEAQMERLVTEGYYSDLAIYAVAEVVPLSPTLLKNKKKTIEQAIIDVNVKRAGETTKSSRRTHGRETKTGDADDASKKAPARNDAKADAKKKASAKGKSTEKHKAKAPAKSSPSARADRKSSKSAKAPKTAKLKKATRKKK